MKISKRQLKQIIREEKQKMMLEMDDMSNFAPSDMEDELFMNLYDGMERSEVSPYYWAEMLKLMKKLGPDTAVMLFEKAVNVLNKNV